MASSDEEDLEALRNAALASLRQKQVPQEPQGIQVLSLSARQTDNQYNQQEAVPVSNPEEDYVYGNYGEVPFAFQQAVLNRQARGRGWRGRGWGRGNSFRFMPKPPPQSALIVIQVEGSETEQRKREERPRDSRPLLLRPQDKWASTEGSSQGSTPPRPKDTSKFSRYDDATDSEEEDDHVEQCQPEYDSININMDMSLDDVSSDTEVELHTHDLGAEAPEHNEMKSDTGPIESNGIENTDLDLTDTEIKDKHTEVTDVEESVIDMSQNITIDEVHSDLNCSQTTEKSDTDVSNVENKVPDTVSIELKHSIATANVTEAEDMSHINKNIDIPVDRDIESDSTPLRDEQTTPLRDELKQEDSVSYSAFSRFNRRNRNESDSADDSSEQSDSGSEVSNSKNSSRGRQSSRSQSDNDSAASDIDATNAEAVVLGEVTQETSQSQQTDTAKISQQSQLSLSPKSSNKSSSSESDSESSSSSSNSESSSVSSGSPAPISSSKIGSNSKRDVKTSIRKSESPVNSSTKSILLTGSKRLVTNDMRGRKHYKTGELKNQRLADTGNRSVDYSRKETEREFKQLLRKVGRERSPHMQHKKSTKEMSINEIQADPEFDATNYRDETMYRRNINRDRPDQSRLDFSRKPDRENRRGESKSNFNAVENYNIGRSRSREQKEMPDEKRYFGEIGRLKGEDQHLNRVISKKKPIKSSKLKQSPNIPSEKSKSNRSVSSTVGKKDDKKLSVKEITKKEKNLKSVKSDTCVIINKYAENVKPVKSQNDIKDRDDKNVNSLKSQTNTKGNDKYRDKSRRKSGEKLRIKSTSDKLRQNNTKAERQLKRRSIEERLKKIANLADESDSESDSVKSVSSVSDISSDSEAEMWRDKKQGATRKTADIELERRRREIKESERKREMNRNRQNPVGERGGGDGEWNKRPKYRDSIMKVGKHDSSYHERYNYRKGDYRERRNLDEEDDMKQRYYRKKNMVFYEEKTLLSKKFEELSSESDSDHRSHRGVISVVKADNKRQAEEIPSLFDISVTRPKLDKDRNVKKKTSKKERLVIHVEKSSDEDISSTKSKKKKVKKKRSWSLEEKMDEVPVQQVVNVTFNKEIEPKQSRQSVYDRLGMTKNKKTLSKVTESDDSGVKRMREVSLPASGKRIKLSGSGKDNVASKPKKSQKESKDDPDAALNLRIRKIQEKNAEILRRKHEVEQDKEKYG